MLPREESRDVQHEQLVLSHRCTMAAGLEASFFHGRNLVGIQIIQRPPFSNNLVQLLTFDGAPSRWASAAPANPLSE